VQRIWTYLKEAAVQTPKAIAQLRDIEQKTGGAMFDGISDEAWASRCDFYPSALIARA